MDVSATVILAGLILVLIWFSVKTSRKHRLPPGPFALPLVGNLPQVDKRAPFKSFLKFSETYGPVITVYLGWKRIVILAGYEAVKEALVDQAEDFAGRNQAAFALKINRGYGLIISNGERWRQLRRFTLTTLRDFGMGRKGMEEWIQEESKHIRDHIETFKAKPFDQTFLLSCTASNVICCLVFGQRFNYKDKKFLHLLNIISSVTAFGSSPRGQIYNICPWLMERLPGRHHSLFVEIQEVKQFIEMKIREHKETLDHGLERLH